MSKNTLLPKTNNREPMFSNSNAFIEYTDNVPGGFAPGSGDQNMMPTTLPADQVPDIESLDMQERTNEQAAAENHPHDSTSRKSDAVDTAPHRSPPAAFSSVIATRSSPPSCPEQAVQASSPPPLSSTSNSLSESIARRSPDVETFASLTTTTTQNAQAIVEPKVNLRSDKLRLEDDDDVEEEEEVDDGKRNEDIPVVQPQGTETSPPLSFKNYNRNHASITDTNAIIASKPLSNAGWGIPKGLGLRGGGESSLTGTSSWGTPAAGAGNATGWGAAPPGPTPPNQWGGATGPRPGPVPPPASAANAASQLTAGIEGTGSLMDLTAMPGAAKSPPAPTPVSNSPGAGGNGSSTWAQAAGKGLPPPAAGAAAAGAPSTKQQLEQLNTMREALFSQDGWGGQHVNQDSNWDIPSSPEPGVAKDGVPVWKPNCNNGTDLWEANLRNGGQPPPAVAKTPWGHTPTSNIGGTWGEDDDAGDSSNVWTGVPAPGGPGGQGGPPPQWGGGGGGAGNQAPMWPGPKKGNEWGDIVGRDPVGRGGGGGGSNWGDPCNDPRAMDPRNDPRNTMDPRDMRGDPRNMMGDMRGNMDMGRGGGNVDGMMRGDPRGISGRLNGAGDGMWGGGPNQHHHNPHQGGPGKMQPVAQGVSQWSGPPPKDLGLGKPSGWEESSPPQQRRNIPNYDDGTSLWGNQPPQNARGMPGPGGGKVSHWKEMPTPGNMGRGGPGGMNCPPGMPQNRGMPASGGPMKPDGSPLWMGPPRNGSWGDGPHDGNPNQWDDSSKQGPPLGNSWPNDPQLSGNSWGGPKPQKNAGGWGDGGGDMDPSAWGHQQKGPGGPPKPITKELLWSSKQFRILADLGYKKEDIEGALRSTSMDLEGAIDLLRLNSVETWRGHGDHTPGFDHPGAGGFQGQRFNPQPMPFAPPGPGGVNNPAGLNPNNGGGNPSLANMSPANVQKLLTQVPPPQQAALGGGQPPFGAGGQRQASNQPSTAQLRMLVQQIQMAVQAGYLNHQILNQPLAPQTLLLLNQLLQQIKVLQQLMQQQTLIHQPPLKGNSNAILHISVQITKTKQQISNLQNQIASQQAIYVKQQQQQPNQPSDAFFPNQPRPDALSLQGNFEQLNMNARDPQVPAAAYQSQQSRLNQWKLPSLDKEGEGNEFSRAPGTTSKPAAANPGSNMNPLQLGQSDSTWSSVSRSSSDTGWPESVDGNPDSKDPWPVSSQQQAPAFTDLVPEFEPGKPWKGTQIKSSEDDPSITPGSVRPLSISAIKDQTEPCNKSPTSSVDTPIPPLSLSSSTWSFNPPATSGYSAPLGKPLGKNTWGEAPPPTTVTTELWGAPKSRGPPPGLAAKNNGAAAASANGWGGLVGGGRSSWGGAAAAPAGTWGSSWLILKNLTPQIDGSTLKTLCVQHGPLQNFHLYLNHGLALAKYNSREEANKAQGALNNCVLVNTTIFAESPADSEVHTLLQHLGHGAQPSQGGNNAAGGGGGAQGASWRPAAPSKADTWGQSGGGGGGGSQLWPPNSSSASALWGESAQEQHRATPSSLNSFLPGDLLGGESM